MYEAALTLVLEVRMEILSGVTHSLAHLVTDQRDGPFLQHGCQFQVKKGGQVE